jgi:hypothetical protein
MIRAHDFARLFFEQFLVDDEVVRREAAKNHSIQPRGAIFASMPMSPLLDFAIV